jgi:dipeptidyl-peptidase-3
MSVGVPAVSAFLNKLQVFKSTADFASGKALYEKYTLVSDAFLALRDEVWALAWKAQAVAVARCSERRAWHCQVLMNRKARKTFVQHVTTMEGGDVHLQSFEASCEVRGCGVEIGQGWSLMRAVGGGRGLA